MSETTPSLEGRLDGLLRRGLGGTRTTDEARAAHLLERLEASPLPPQRRSVLSAWWPSALLDVDLMPAWPRVGALAGAGALGVAIGLFGADVSAFEQRGPAAVTIAGETDLAALVFDPEPVTGVRP